MSNSYHWATREMSGTRPKEMFKPEPDDKDKVEVKLENKEVCMFMWLSMCLYQCDNIIVNLAFMLQHDFGT